MRDGEVVTHHAHNLEIAGAIPSPATILKYHENRIRFAKSG